MIIRYRKIRNMVLYSVVFGVVFSVFSRLLSLSSSLLKHNSEEKKQDKIARGFSFLPIVSEVYADVSVGTPTNLGSDAGTPSAPADGHGDSTDPSPPGDMGLGDGAAAAAADGVGSVT